jgi:hypothetical protein
MSEAYQVARDAANSAFDEHCNAWNALQKIPKPTSQDLAKWLTAKERLNEAQEKFENIVRQVSAQAAQPGDPADAAR